MQVNDFALGVHDAFMPLNSPDLTGSSADFGTNSFELPGDHSRLAGLSLPVEDRLGVRLDGNGSPVRFDIPSSSFSNAGAIEDDDPATTPPTWLTLIDENQDGSEAYFIEQGSELFILGAQQAEIFDFV